MKCIKCGNEVDSSKCKKCRFEFETDVITLLWEMSPEYLSALVSKVHSQEVPYNVEKEDNYIKKGEGADEEKEKLDKTNVDNSLSNEYDEESKNKNLNDGFIKDETKNNNYWKKSFIFSIFILGFSVFIFWGFLNQNEKKWSDWSDSLPKHVTDERYDIKERLLYSSRNKEILTDESDTEREGWELFDAVDNGLIYGEWSDWSTEEVFPSNIKEVQEELKYRSREKEFITSETQTKEGWSLDKVEYVANSDAEWSEWTLVEPNVERSKYEVQEKVQFSYREKKFTTSNSDFLEGWIYYDEEKEYGDWSEWGNNFLEGSETVEVDTRQIKTGTQYHMAHYCTGNVSGAQYLTAKRNITTNDVFNTNCTFHSLGWFSSLDQFYSIDDGEYLYKSSNTSNCYRCSNTCYRWYIVEQKDVLTTQYSYRNVKPIYHHYQWSEWSEYSDNETNNENCEVRKRTLYRYRDISEKPVYVLWKWGEWSDWTSEEIFGSNDCEVEKKHFYRTRDITEDKVYYFRRYSEWSEFSENNIEGTDLIEVKTKTQYSYKKK